MTKFYDKKTNEFNGYEYRIIKSSSNEIYVQCRDEDTGKWYIVSFCDTIKEARKVLDHLCSIDKWYWEN